ncbi:MAG: HEAT repeat domain-containing protein [Candidatus Micrarchaeota archaeon]
MRRTGAALIAAAVFSGRPDFSSFSPKIELGAAFAQGKGPGVAAWVKEGGARELADGDENVRLNAAWKIRYAVEEGADVSPALAGLVKALVDPNASVKGYAAFALEFHYLLKREWTKAAALLNHKDNEIRSQSSWALGAAAEKKADLSRFLKELGKALSNDNEFVRWNAAKALALHHLGKGARAKAERLAASDNDDVRQGAEEALRIYRPR